jgi:hypothetical protein
MQIVKRKWITILLVVFILTISIVIVTVVNTQQRDQVEEGAGIEYYDNIVALDFYLNIAYYREGDFFHLEYSQTSRTEDLLGRWQAITEVYPFMAYPEEAIERNDWRKVANIFDEGINQYREKALDDEEFRLNNPHSDYIAGYITINIYDEFDEGLKESLGLD